MDPSHPQENSTNVKSDMKETAHARDIPPGQDIPQRPKNATETGADARELHKGVVCEHCDLPGVDNEKGRNIVVCLDGTSNQYGKYNTNVVELFSRVIKDDRQIVYYNSGIGTYARPSWRSWSYFKRAVDHTIDLAIAWKFESGIFAAYEWISDRYQPGDRVNIIGFSRGAYQARVLAAMIQEIGLLYPGNKAQIPFAFELYAGFKGENDPNMIPRFKKTFSRDVRVHHLGIWDAVSSIGLVRGKSLPGTDTFHENVCYFRHALALDERRVKFLPEYICGGESDTTERKGKNGIPRVKEVWFAGCHSDIGGGSVNNAELNNASIPVLWMANEARFTGLRLHESAVEWKWDVLETMRPTESLNWFWRCLEILPITRLSYTGRNNLRRWTPHLAGGRVVKPGQRVHASVAFIRGDYKPKATLALSDKSITWKDIVGTGTKENRDWIKDILELDLFDLDVSHIVKTVRADLNNTDFIGRLDFLALTREGAEAILGLDDALTLLNTLLKNKGRIHTATGLLQKLIPHDASRRAIMRTDLVETLRETSESGDESTCRDVIAILRAMAEKHGTLPLPTNIPTEVAAATAGGIDLLREPRHVVLLYLSSIYIAQFYIAQHERSNTRTDLAMAEQLLKEALAMLSRSHSDRVFVRNGLATAIEARATVRDIEFAISIRRKVMHIASNPSVFSPDLARSLIHLSTALSSEGIRAEDALHATEDAVVLYRHLSEKDHATFDQDLAMSLNNLSNRRSALGDLEKALDAINEGVALYRQLATTTASRFERHLATSLQNQAGCLAALGFREEGLTAADEAVRLHREIAAASAPPSTHDPDLAAALISLSYRLRGLGRREEALASVEESLKIYRRLSADDPASVRESLARSLHILASCLSDLGRREDALSATEEAVGIRRALAADRPAAFHPDLAVCLNSLSAHLSALGRREEALATIEEAVGLLRALATDRPAAFNSDLASSLNSLSVDLSALGRRDEALSATDEAVKLYRALATDRPAAFNSNLANSLNSLSVDLSALGRRDEALSAIEEAVKLYRALATDRPAAFNPALASSLNNRSVDLSALGRRDEALSATDEAVKLYRALATDRPAAFNPDLAKSLNNLSAHLSALDRLEEALSAIKEAVELRRTLATDRPAAFNPDLAESLINLSAHLFALDRPVEEALSAVEEAVGLLRALAADRPAAFNPDLATSLNNLSSYLSKLGRFEAALSAIEEAVELYRALAADRPAAFNADLAASLYNLSYRLSNLDRKEESLSAAEEAAGLFRALAADRPAVFNTTLMHSLKLLSRCLSALDRTEDAENVEAERAQYGPVSSDSDSES